MALESSDGRPFGKNFGCTAPTTFNAKQKLHNFILTISHRIKQRENNDESAQKATSFKTMTSLVLRLKNVKKERHRQNVFRMNDNGKIFVRLFECSHIRHFVCCVVRNQRCSSQVSFACINTF